jgi:hypothetical protein
LPGDIRREAGEALSLFGNDPDDLLEAQRRNLKNIHDRTVRRRRKGESLAFDRPETVAGARLLPACHMQTALTVSEAFERMRGQGIPKPRELRDRVLAASIHSGPWPATPSAWSEGQYVAVVNAHAIVEQWRGVHDPGREPSLTETVDGQARKIWKDNSGREHVNLDEGMVRGLPRHVAGRGPYMLDVVYRRLSTLPIRSEHGSFCR